MAISRTGKNTFSIKSLDIDFFNIIFLFNEKPYAFFNILKEYQDNYIECNRQEILPGIWLTDISNFAKSRVPRGIIEKLKFMFIKKIGWSFKVENYNLKDSFEIINSRTYTSQKYASHSNRVITYEKSLVTVNAQQLPYPVSMGGGAYGCAVWNVFSILGLFDAFNYDYNFYSLDQLIRNVTNNHRLLDKCRNQKTCWDIYNKLKNGEYKTQSNKNPYIRDIRVYYNGSTYSIGDGNHRICVAKRFEIESIPVELTCAINAEKETESTESYTKQHAYISSNNNSCKKVMRAYRSIIDKLGLSANDANYLLQTFLDDFDLVQFLEDRKGKSIDAILSEVLGKNE